MRIDAHQHFWRYSPSEYNWIDESMQAIRRDFLPIDLLRIFEALRLDGSVAVQARQSRLETEWLLKLSDSAPHIKGVVGWVPLAADGANIGRVLDAYALHPRFKGVRHVLQGEPDAYFDDAGFNDALREVARRGLTYDLLVFARQLPAATALVDRHPNLPIVLDHIAKPVVDGSPSPAWQAQLRELARRPNVLCKFSGVVTEAPGWRWNLDTVRPYFDVVLSAFGPQRLMFGSDWPVCVVAAGYGEWFATVEQLIAPLSAAERQAILGGAATGFYHLNP